MFDLWRPAPTFRNLLAASASAIVLSACGGIQIVPPRFDLPHMENGTIVIPPFYKKPLMYTKGQQIIDENSPLYNGWQAQGSFMLGQPRDASGMPDVYIDQRYDTDGISISRVIPRTEAHLLTDCMNGGLRAKFHKQCSAMDATRLVVATGVSGQKVITPVYCPTSQYRPTESRIPGMAASEIHITVPCSIDTEAAYNQRSPNFKGIQIRNFY